MKFIGIKLIHEKPDISYPDSDYKIFFLIFIISYFDFIEFMIGTFNIPKIKIISKSLLIRLGSLLTISASVLSYFLLKLPIFKHQKYSLFIIFISFIIVLICEFFFQNYYKSDNIYDFLYAIILIFIDNFFSGFKDVIEKYILEVDYINPFKMIMVEGIFGCIIIALYS